MQSQKRKDQFISSELFPLAAFEDNGKLADILKKCGATKSTLEKAIDEERGGQTVADQHAEDQRNALSKYTIDLTAQAEKGKLDPVIGRDAEDELAIPRRRQRASPAFHRDLGVLTGRTVPGGVDAHDLCHTLCLDGDLERRSAESGDLAGAVHLRPDVGAARRVAPAGDEVTTLRQRHTAEGEREHAHDDRDDHVPFHAFAFPVILRW